MNDAPPRVDKPNYTQIPNVILDSLHEMTPAEAVVVLAICRQTFGWHKRGEKLSLTKLQALTGMGRHAVLDAINAALEHGWIRRKPAGQTYLYSVHIQEVAVRKQHQLQEVAVRLSHQSQNSTGAETAPVTSAKTAPALVLKQHQLPPTLKKDKEILFKEKDSSSSAPRPNEFALYEAEIGLLTPTVADNLKADLEETPPGWVQDAIRIAAEQNKRSYAYIRGILKRWRTEGRGDSKQHSNGTHPEPLTGKWDSSIIYAKTDDAPAPADIPF